ncbi:MAG: cellulase family glycosylhydrolase [Microthrixaceae bacterium]
MEQACRHAGWCGVPGRYRARNRLGGAPEWATFLDDETTCRTRSPPRESPPAVQTAFTSFSDNRDGIRDAYAEMWGHMVRRLGDRPGFVGYDLMNEPFPAAADPDTETASTDFVLDVIDEIRAAEAEVGRQESPIFLEPMVLAPSPGNQVQIDRFTDRNLVYSPHVYPFGGISAEAVFSAHSSTADDLGLPLWIGEYYLGADTTEKIEKTADLLDVMDDQLANWVWWTWQVACGDPHFVQDRSKSAEEHLQASTRSHLMITDCPSGDHEPNTKALELVNRGYPRAAPGTITNIDSDPQAGTLTVGAADAEVGEELVAWLPPSSGTDPHVEASSGLENVVVTEAPGGAVLIATTTADTYELVVTPE